MRQAAACALVLFGLGGLAGCTTSTQLIVVVDTDLSIPSQVDEIRITVTGPDGMMASQSEMLPSDDELPFTLALVPSGDSLGPIEVLAEARLGGVVQLSRRARVTLVRGESRMLVLDLLRSCLGVTCPSASLSCGAMGCVPVEVTELPIWTGTPPRRDAGLDAPPFDAGPFDAGPRLDALDAGPRDAGPPCTLDSECDDGVACTTDTCGATGCQYVVDNGACDDSNPCTDDVCTPGTGCGSVNNTVPCNDDVFCNGFDTCGSGTCSVHGGNPCSGSTVCDEAGDRCTGCTAATDCPADSTGTWGACDYADGCDQSATRTRTNRSYVCTSGSCVPTDVPESEPCTRSTDGMTCGTGSCGGFGACEYSDGCDEAAVASRTCTDLTCAGGTCRSNPRTETMPCSRSTTGMSCGATTCGAYGACDYSGPCDDAANQSRTCNDFSCASGSCAPTPRTENQACTRSTNGTSCGGGMVCSGGSCVPCTPSLSGAFGTSGSSYMTGVAGAGAGLTFTDGSTGAMGTITASSPVTFSGSFTAGVCIWQVLGTGTTLRFVDWDGTTAGNITVSGARTSQASVPPCASSPYGCFPPCLSRIVGAPGALQLTYTDGSTGTVRLDCL